MLSDCKVNELLLLLDLYKLFEEFDVVNSLGFGLLFDCSFCSSLTEFCLAISRGFIRTCGLKNFNLTFVKFFFGSKESHTRDMVGGCGCSITAFFSSFLNSPFVISGSFSGSKQLKFMIM